MTTWRIVRRDSGEPMLLVRPAGGGDPEPVDFASEDEARDALDRLVERGIIDAANAEVDER